MHVVDVVVADDGLRLLDLPDLLAGQAQRLSRILADLARCPVDDQLVDRIDHIV